MDCRLPGFSLYGMLQAGILGWVAIFFSKGSSWPRDRICVSYVSYTGRSVVPPVSDFGAQENKVCLCFHFPPSICHEVMGLDVMILDFWMLSFKPAFSLFSFNFIKQFFSFSSLSAIRLVLAYLMERAMARHSSTLAWKIPWMEEPGGLQSMGLLRVGHDWPTSLSLFTFMHWRRKWQPTPVFLPGESQGQRSLVGYDLWGPQSRTRLKRLSSSSSRPIWS